MNHLLLEALRALLLVGIILALWRFDRRSRKDAPSNGLSMVLAGFGLMLLGTLLHLASDLFEPAANTTFPVEYRTTWGWLAEHFIGYIGGLLLTLLGLMRWLKEVHAQKQWQVHILNAITRSQANFISTSETRQAFDSLLRDILDLTGSEYGFIGEVHQRDGQPYLKTHAITNIAWNEETRRFYAEHAPQGMEFTNLKSLFGAALLSGEPVIANDPEQDPRRGVLPPGHPPLNAFLGLPVHAGGRMLGMLGIANRRGGYDQQVVELLQPLLSTIGQLIEARQALLAHQVIEASHQRLSLAASAQHVQAVLDHVHDGIITIDDRGIVASCNLSAERIFGYAAVEVIGHNINMLMPEPFRSRHDGYLHNYRNSGVAKIIGIGREVEGQRKNGTTFPMDLAVTAIERDGQPLYIGIVRDITERKRLERLKSEFLSTVSHELRTPLTSIRGALGLVAGGALGELPEQIGRLVGIAHKNSEYLTHLINDLLDMEKMVAGGMHFDLQAQKLMPLVEQSIEANRAYAEDRRVSFLLSSRVEDAVACVDAKRFLQVMANLLSNAAKFSPENGQVEVAVTRLNDHVRVAVRDHGPGIPAGFRDRIFEKFSQADASDTRQKGGSGLGLAITRELVQRMAGQIGFDSIKGAGATFHVDLPLLASVTGSERRNREETEITGAPRLLVVEDNRDVADLLATMLRHAGFNVDLAGDVHSAMALLAEQRYAAMTLDLNLPDRNGVELIRTWRAAPATYDLPIIVLSAHLEEGQLALAGELDTVGWLDKPFEQAHLLKAVRQAVHGNAAAKPKVLHVEDDADLLQVVATLARDVAEFVPARNLAEARTRLRQGLYSVVVLDLDLPDGSGWELIPDLRALTPMPRLIILSGHETAASQAEAVAAAMVKSRISNDDLLATLRRVIRQPEN